MKKFLVLALLFFSSVRSQEAVTEWMTVLIHGTVGFQSNASYRTICQIRHDCIEGTPYERNVKTIREHPYLFALQPMQEIGLRPVIEDKNGLSAAYAFGVLHDTVLKHCGKKEKNYYYTFGWSGLISERKRKVEAKMLYRQLKRETLKFEKRGKRVKIRLIAYSHGATMVLNLADAYTVCVDNAFVIDETFLIGLPVLRKQSAQIQSPIFKELYNIYSRGDKVQRLDIFSPDDLISHRYFKGCVPDKLTQIEMKVTSSLRRNPCICVPPHMRGIINQSPGHIELWFFGWTRTSYRKNLSMFPLPGAVFAPYLACSSRKLACKHVTIDIRPESETAFISPFGFDDRTAIPFLDEGAYKKLIDQAYEFHPSRPELKEKFVKLQETMKINVY